MGDRIPGFSLHHKFHAPAKSKFSHLNLLFIIVLCCALAAKAQDSPGRFEAGGNLTVLKTSVGANFGPGLEGDFNFGRHFALDAALSWMPADRPGHLTQGLFGAKVGTRTQHFGFFGKIRPGFVSIGDTFRQETLVFTGALAMPSVRFARLTERAVDLGGVFEYYPARHWALRYDLGDTVIFEEEPTFTLINAPFALNGPRTIPNHTRNRFQFSTGLHYRF